MRALCRALSGERLEHFTFVMATGIVSTAIHNSGADLVSLILMWIAVAGYAVLCVGAVVGPFVGAPAPIEQTVQRRFSVLAIGAASAVLAARFAALGWQAATAVLVAVAALAWLVLQYGVLIALVGGTSTGRRRIGLAAVDGSWFLWVVATQAVAVSAAAYAKIADTDLVATVAVLCWGLGVLQLILVATLVTARLLFVGIATTDETAPYWVFMGSGAISILAAAEVLGTAEEQVVFPREVVGGVAMAIWAFGTWLIPLLVGLMLWQRTRPGAPRGYRPALWAMVFPIGMYGESTRQLGFIRGTGWLEDIGTWEAWIALAVWAVVTVGMLRAGSLAVVDYSRRRRPS